jgi:glycosyltransferase involved in cell wall biosynthesis
MSITFIIPCFNSKNIIAKNYLILNNFIKKHNLKSKIIYINDGSKDSTVNELKKIKNKKIRIINNKTNVGKSFSIINALKKVETEKVILIDCDLPYFNYLKKIVYYLDSYDLAIVNRKIHGSKNLDRKKNFYQIARHYMSNFLGHLVEIFLKLNVNGDTQAGLKGFRLNNKIKNKKFFSKYYFFDIELISFFKKNKLKIKLIPVKYKISNQSSIKFFSFKNFNIILEFFKILRKSKV